MIDRAIVQSEFRTEKDLFDRISGGAGPGGVKAVAPSGDEFIIIELPEDVGDQVSVLGEKLSVMRPDGVDNFNSAGTADRDDQQCDAGISSGTAAEEGAGEEGAGKEAVSQS